MSNVLATAKIFVALTVSMAALHSYAAPPPFDWHGLDVEKCFMTELPETPIPDSISINCNQLIKPALDKCERQQGVVGTIGKRAFCRIPKSAATGTLPKRLPGSPPPFVPTEAEAAQFKVWTAPRKGIPPPSPTYPGDPAQAMKLCPGHPGCPASPTPPHTPPKE